MPQFVNLVVYLRILFDICVSGRYISLRLIIVIVGHKVFHRVLREKLLEFTVKLCGQSLVVTDYKRRLLYFLDYVGHGEGFAGTGNSHESLRSIAVQYAVCQPFYGLRLITGRGIFGMKYKSVHCNPPYHLTLADNYAPIIPHLL